MHFGLVFQLSSTTSRARLSYWASLLRRCGLNGHLQRRLQADYRRDGNSGWGQLKTNHRRLMASDGANGVKRARASALSPLTSQVCASHPPTHRYVCGTFSWRARPQHHSDPTLDRLYARDEYGGLNERQRDLDMSHVHLLSIGLRKTPS